MRTFFACLNDFIKISVLISISNMSDHLHFEKVSSLIYFSPICSLQYKHLSEETIYLVEIFVINNSSVDELKLVVMLVCGR